MRNPFTCVITRDFTHMTTHVCMHVMSWTPVVIWRVAWQCICVHTPCLLEFGCSGAALLVLSQVWRSGINTLTWSGWSGKERDPSTSVSRHISWPTIYIDPTTILIATANDQNENKLLSRCVPVRCIVWVRGLPERACNRVCVYSEKWITKISVFESNGVGTHTHTHTHTQATGECLWSYLYTSIFWGGLL